jgi:hypothetical protein
MHAPPDPAPPKHVGLSIDIVSGPAGPLARVWTAKCDSPTDFSSIASVNPGMGFVRAVGLSRRKLQLIERARHAARLLRAGAAITDVVCGVGMPAGASRPRFAFHTSITMPS